MLCVYERVEKCFIKRYGGNVNIFSFTYIENSSSDEKYLEKMKNGYGFERCCAAVAVRINEFFTYNFCFAQSIEMLCT